MGQYASQAQQRFFHTDTAKAAGVTKDEVDVRDKASKGKKLPAKKAPFSKDASAARAKALRASAKSTMNDNDGDE